MKVLLSLAFMCCFIGGIVGAGCNCGPLKECYDKNKYVVKANVKEIDETYQNYVQLTIEERRDFKTESDFEYVFVPNACEKKFDRGVTYLFMGNKVNKKIMKTPVDDGFIKLWDNVSEKQRKFLRNAED